MTRDEPPFVFGPLARAAAGVGGLFKVAIRAIGRGPMLALSGLAMLVIFGAVLSSAMRAPDGSVLQGVLTGAFAALLFAGGAAWTLIWAFASEPVAVDDRPRSEALQQALAPTLRELAAVRAETMSRARSRSLLRVPLCIAGALVFWVLQQWGSDPPGAAVLILYGIVSAVIGEVWAVQALDENYRQSYKDRVLPLLAARFGDLTYQRASFGSVAELQQHGIFSRFDGATAVDEIRGTYKDLAISLVQLKLERGSGDDATAVFDGLLVELTLPRHLSGTTAVVADQGLWANLMRLKGPGLGHMTFDDPLFDQRFRVYGTDPTETRALLTPRFRQRYLDLATQTRFTLPGSLASGNRFVLALPKRDNVNLFSPSGFWTDDDRRTLMVLSRDIEAALTMADPVIELFA